MNNFPQFPDFVQKFHIRVLGSRFKNVILIEPILIDKKHSDHSRYTDQFGFHRDWSVYRERTVHAYISFGYVRLLEVEDYADVCDTCQLPRHTSVRRKLYQQDAPHASEIGKVREEHQQR